MAKRVLFHTVNRNEVAYGNLYGKSLRKIGDCFNLTIKTADTQTYNYIRILLVEKGLSQ